MSLFRLIIVFALICGGIVSGTAQEEAPKKGIPIEITSDGENRYQAGVAVAQDNVVVRYGADVLYADRVTYDTKTREVMADGNVRIYSGTQIYRGEHLSFNFETKRVSSIDFGLANFPAFAGGRKVTTPEDGHYRVESGFFTTDDREHASYRLKANTVEIYPDNQVVLKNVVLFIGPVPIAWVPFYTQSVNSNSAAFVFSFGTTGRFGFFEYNTYNWVINPSLEASFHFDIREKRGVAGGVDVKYKPTKEGEGLFKSYFARDDDFTENPTALARTPVYSDRYRFGLQQKAPFGTDISTTVDLNILSDPYVTEDFFKSEFAKQRQPDNFGEAVFYNPNFTISALARKDFNRFNETEEQLPGVNFETKRVKLFGTDFAYEGQTSAVNFRREFSNQQTVNRNYDSVRWDTFHEFVYQREYFGWLSLTPRVGARATAWSDDNSNLNTQGSKNARGRFVPDAGAEASFKLSRVWSDAKNQDLAVNGLRHVAEPYVNFQYVPRPDTDPTELLGYDTRVANTWAQPINFTAYNSIDSIDRQAVVRHGIRNKLQTKRDGQNWDLVDWDIFADLNLDRHVDETVQQTDDKYSHVYNDVKIRPFPWLTFDSQSSINTKSGSYSMTDNSITWQMTRSYEATLGNSYLSNLNVLDTSGLPIPNSNLLYLRNFYRINEHWQIATRHSFEADDRVLQDQSYTIYRDLSAWQVALTYSETDYRQRSSDSTIYAAFTLKAFPEAKFSLSQ